MAPNTTAIFQVENNTKSTNHLETENEDQSFGMWKVLFAIFFSNLVNIYIYSEAYKKTGVIKKVIYTCSI